MPDCEKQYLFSRVNFTSVPVERSEEETYIQKIRKSLVELERGCILVLTNVPNPDNSLLGIADEGLQKNSKVTLYLPYLGEKGGDSFFGELKEASFQSRKRANANRFHQLFVKG